jgi:hypothetical protein
VAKVAGTAIQSRRNTLDARAAGEDNLKREFEELQQLREAVAEAERCERGRKNDQGAS